ncbi:MAG: GGDEF domain-containing protein [Marinobacterium sp.]|nr:GGDEF domain-containing protein [Marinobacterium sp.]
MTQITDTTRQLTEQTLAEQLKITDREIEDRKQLLGFTREDAEVLASLRGYIRTHLDEIVDAFYKRQKMNSEFALLIGDSETFRRLHASMHTYIRDLFEGYYDADYVNRRLRIGKVHKRIGVSPKLYLAAMVQLESILQATIEQAKGNNRTNCQQCRAASQALHKLLMFDVQFVFDTYIHSLISEVETTRSKVEEYASSLEDTVASRTRELERLSRQDPLTGLENQRSFYDHLRRELARAERQQQPLTLLYLDLNRFKQLNDSYGHKRGDEVLQLTGQSMQSAARVSDICCRYGGDEFCVLLPETSHGDAINYAQRMIEHFSQGDCGEVTFSIGLAQTGPDSFVHGDTLVRQADKSMYRAKAQAHLDGNHHIDRNGNTLVSIPGKRIETTGEKKPPATPETSDPSIQIISIHD